MSVLKPYVSFVRVSLELASPMLIATGDARDDFDSSFIRDANDLPMIPGTTLAGNLLHLARQLQMMDVVSLMGTDQQRSQIQVSAAVVHNAENQPCEGLLPRQQMDELLVFLSQSEPLTRDRVALNERGVAVDKGKYDFVAVPAGTRFSFELKVQTSEPHNQVVEQLLQLCSHIGFRLGQKTRSGLGKVKIFSQSRLSLNLTQASDRERLARISRALGNHSGFDVVDTSVNHHAFKKFKLQVRALSGLRIGQGRYAFDSSLNREKSADALIWSEPVIIWGASGLQQIRRHQMVIPASSIRGALVHRTLFHYYRLQQDFIEETPSGRALEFGHLQIPEPLHDLLGVVTQDNSLPAQASRLIFDDVYLDESSCVYSRQHNSIDRFTGGTREHVLFEEELLWRPQFDIHIAVTQPEKIAPQCMEAFECALDDLVNGNLALGAGASKGNGYVEGSIYEY